MQFSELGLAPELLSAVQAEGYDTPTPIQEQAIPHVLAGRDLEALAQTGTGKTAAFVLPILQRLHAAAQLENSPLKRAARVAPRVLILCPTRELAAQILESIRNYGANLPFRSLAIYGGVGMQPQVQVLRRGVDLVVACPGRLLDHMQQRTIDLSKVETLVLDEADRMFDMGFIRDIRKIVERLPKERQTLLFSATFAPEVRDLAQSILKNPATVEVARRNAPTELVNQTVIQCDADKKRDLVLYLFEQHGWHQTLLFCRTKHGADALAKRLMHAGVRSMALHGNKTQGARTKALEEFKTGKLAALVATDIAARGLDIVALPRVINVDLPNVPEDYVHRIGRTGRAGNEGEAISLVSAEERVQLRDIERLMKKDLPRSVIAGFEPHDKPTSKPAVPRAAPHPSRNHAPRTGKPGTGGKSAPAGRRSGPGGAGGGAGKPRAPSAKAGGAHSGQRHR